MQPFTFHTKCCAAMKSVLRAVSATLNALPPCAAARLVAMLLQLQPLPLPLRGFSLLVRLGLPNYCNAARELCLRSESCPARGGVTLMCTSGWARPRCGC